VGLSLGEGAAAVLWGAQGCEDTREDSRSGDVRGASQPVAGTNNEAERTLRPPAQARQTGRTNKTPVGARRQTIIVSVLESLRLYLPTFTLANVIEEIKRWWQAGQSCFTKLLKKMKLPAPTQSILDKVMPVPDG